MTEEELKTFDFTPVNIADLLPQRKPFVMISSLAVWENDEDENTVYAGFVGNVGLEYTFWFPLQLSVDFRPRLMFGDGGLRSDGPFTLGIGVRYAF